MLVDPGILRAFAGQVDIAADVGATEVGGRTFSAGDALPGSTMQAAVGEHFSQMATTLSQIMTKMATALRGASDPFEVADDALAGQFCSHRCFGSFPGVRAVSALDMTCGNTEDVEP